MQGKCHIHCAIAWSPWVNVGNANVTLLRLRVKPIEMKLAPFRICVKIQNTISTLSGIVEGESVGIGNT